VALDCGAVSKELMHRLQRITSSALLANLALWILVWVDLAFRLVPYEPHRPRFEEQPPVIVFGRRALPLSQMHATSLLVLEVVQAPSFLAVRPLVHVFNRNPGDWDRTFFRISLWSYLLIVVMFVSFLQWYLVGRFVLWLLRAAHI
jgi:hypothetical protein